MTQSTTNMRLDEFIQLVLETHDISFVVDNFIQLREQYYELKEQSLGG